MMDKVIETPHAFGGIGYIPGRMLKFDRENNLLIGKRQDLPKCLHSTIYIQSPISRSSKEFRYRCSCDFKDNSWNGPYIQDIPIEIMTKIISMNSRFSRTFAEVWKCPSENLYFIA